MHEWTPFATVSTALENNWGKAPGFYFFQIKFSTKCFCFYHYHLNDLYLLDSYVIETKILQSLKRSQIYCIHYGLYHTVPILFAFEINQCCGSGSAWIWIKLKGRIRIRIRFEVISWIQIHTNLQMASQNVWNMSLFEHFIKLWAFIWKLGSGSGSSSQWKVGSGSEYASK
jgi:hypothetical protein